MTTDQKELLLALAEGVFGKESAEARIADLILFFRAARRGIAEHQEPIGWIHKDDIEYDGTTHSLRTLNVQPGNFEDWLPFYIVPAERKEQEDVNLIQPFRTMQLPHTI